MGLQLCVNDIENIVYEFGTQQFNVDSAGIQEANFNYDYKTIKGWYKEIVLENFKISYGSSQLLENTTLFFDLDEKGVEMRFNLNGNSLIDANDMLNSLSMNSNCHNIFFYNDIKAKIDWYSDTMYLFEVSFYPTLFKKYLPDDETFKEFKQILANDKVGILKNCNYPITSEMLLLIYEIINCPWKDTFRKLFLESKVLELLLLQMNQINSYQDVPRQYQSSKLIIDKMHYAKDIILKKINAPMSLMALARAVSTNEGTLKKAFKEVFGTTVFGFISDTRMEQAREMLITGEFSIKEVSKRVGYKHSQHFSTAFKRKYGISPSKIRK